MYASLARAAGATRSAQLCGGVQALRDAASLRGRPAFPGEALGSEGHADIVRRGCEDDECIREVCGPDLTGGGIVGSEIGRSMDQQDRRLAQEAEFEALERGRSGERRVWRNPDNGRYGEVVPGTSFRRGEMDCRDYTHTVYIDGRPQAMRGTACRNPDGTWSSVG